MSKGEDLLELAFSMQASYLGISIREIEKQFGVSRRTAERMRDRVLRAFPHAVEVYTGERTKRWRIPLGTVNRLLGFSVEELGALEQAIAVLDRDNLDRQANHLKSLQAKLRSVIKPEIARKVEPDLEALLEAESLAFRPGPKSKAKTKILDDLRHAIMGFRIVTIKYKARNKDSISQRKIHPYGFLYGHRHYLIAYNLHKGDEGYRMFSLPNISKVEVSKEYFSRDENFDLERFASQSFGLFQEDPFDVVWKFSPRAAKDAKDFVFHPDQKIDRQTDGSLVVRFRAGGALEMCWYLFSWGKDVEVLEPKHLANMLRDHRPIWDGLP
jgi:predicted DNA-binding transcriptional regulator YafY